MAGASQQQARLLLSVIVIALVALLGLGAWFVVSNLATETETARPVPETIESTDDPTIDEEAFNASIADAINDVPEAQVIAQPLDYTFDAIDGFYWYPVSTDFGPFEFTPGRSAGFDRSQTGAALAAVHLYNRTSFGAVGWQQSLDEQTTGFGIDVRRTENQIVESEPQLLESIRLKAFNVGWDVLDFNPNDATILAFFGARGSDELAKVELRVVWDEEDWKLVVPEDNLFVQSLGGRPLDVDLRSAFE